MRELRVDIFNTVDGFAGPGSQSAPYWGYGAPGLHEWVDAQLAEDHVMLMGANTYREMAKYAEYGPPRMAELPKIVFSQTLTLPLTWENTTLIDEPTMTSVPALKAMDDGLPMRTIGSLSLVRSLFRDSLVDRLRVMVFPTIHGVQGEVPAFAGLPDLRLRLTGTTVLDDQVVLLDYSVGEPS